MTAWCCIQLYTISVQTCTRTCTKSLVSRVPGQTYILTSVPSALSAFSVQFGPWDAFCMTTVGMHDNG
jgi:hypothetical protein